MGMKREAVQEERQRGRGGAAGGEEEAGDGLGPADMPADRILEAERVSDTFEVEASGAGPADLQAKFKLAAEKQLSSLVEWAKHIPHFSQLAIDDQVALLRGGWNELMIAGFAHRSVGIQNGKKGSQHTKKVLKGLNSRGQKFQ